jgi:hypothetical protein
LNNKQFNSKETRDRNIRLLLRQVYDAAIIRYYALSLKKKNDYTLESNNTFDNVFSTVPSVGSQDIVNELRNRFHSILKTISVNYKESNVNTQDELYYIVEGDKEKIMNHGDLTQYYHNLITIINAN